MATVPVTAAVAAAIMQGSDLLVKLIVAYNSLPDADAEATAQFEALLPVLQAEVAWLAQYQPKTPRAE